MRALVLAAVLLAAPPAAAEDYELRVAAPASVAPGEAATVSLTIAGTGGRTVSKDGPVRVQLASETLTLPRRRYDRRDAADPAADAPRFDLRLTAPTAGAHELALDVRFWLCGTRACRPIRATRTIVVDAPAPPEPAPPPAEPAP